MNLFVEAPWLKAKTDERVELMVKEGALDIAQRVRHSLPDEPAGRGLGGHDRRAAGAVGTHL